MNGEFKVPTAVSSEKAAVVSTEQEAGWAPGPVSTIYRREKPLAPTMNLTIPGLPSVQA